ncbi:zinc ribbon domain-containing protein, partial [uncultured Flavobacterium sp.]|uniref:zinc ribbon domain-containing protein n=1 Tax=uncultured Flavobacterium sp. TaxID=165435 RepID=UPI0030EDAF50
MSLIKCPECNKGISSSAKVCPSCGYKISKDGIGCFTYLLIGLGIIIFIYIIGSNSSNENVFEDENTYTQSWRSPEGLELSEIGRVMVKNN